MVIKKEDLLSGKNRIQKIKIEALDDELYLRPLTRAEFSECEAIENRALGDYVTSEQSKRRGRRQKPKSSINTEGKVNIEKVSKATYESEKHMIYLSINNEENNKHGLKFTEDEIGQFDTPVFVEIAAHVKEISGLDVTEEEVKNFPEDE